MKQAELTFRGDTVIIEITDAIFNLYMKLDVDAKIHFDNIRRPDGSMEWFKETDDEYDDEASEIVDGYLIQKGEEIFDFYEEDFIVIEDYVPKNPHILEITFIDMDDE